jgi:hypothetical protein
LKSTYSKETRIFIKIWITPIRLFYELAQGTVEVIEFSVKRMLLMNKMKQKRTKNTVPVQTRAKLVEERHSIDNVSSSFSFSPQIKPWKMRMYIGIVRIVVIIVRINDRIL